MIDIVDEISGAHDVRLAFHLGPDVQAELHGASATLHWRGAAMPGAARLELPRELGWSLHRGETHPILGWYSTGLGRRVPAVTLLGCGRSAPGELFGTRLEFVNIGTVTESDLTRPAVSWGTPDAMAVEVPGIQAEAG